jgi:hypothetical protein
MIEGLDTTDKIVGGTTLVGIAFYSLRKMMTFWKTENTAQANTQAFEAQFKSLQEAIEASKKEAVEFRAQFALFDRKLHQQQRTITRMEMLLRQFSGLVSQHGIQVPVFMREELEALIETDIERSRKDDK